VYSQKADEAQKAGDLAEQEKARNKMATLDKTFDLVKANADRAERARQNELDRQNNLALKKLGEQQKQSEGQQQANEYLDSLVNTTRAGGKWLDTTNIPNDKNAKAAALVYAKQNGLTAVDKGVADRLRTSEEVQSNMDQIDQVVASFLPENAQGRVVSVPRNLLAAWTQSNPDIASFGNTYAAAIRNIQALAGGQGSGFRLTNSEVNMATKNFPRITDDLPTARRKLAWERQFLANKERTFFQRNMSKPGGQTTQPEAADPLGIR
jgi:hypothetical protein